MRRAHRGLVPPKGDLSELPAVFHTKTLTTERHMADPRRGDTRRRVRGDRKQPMASFQCVRCSSKPSACAEGSRMTPFAGLVGLLAALSDAALGAVVATHELAALQRN